MARPTDSFISRWRKWVLRHGNKDVLALLLVIAILLLVLLPVVAIRRIPKRTGNSHQHLPPQVSSQVLDTAAESKRSSPIATRMARLKLLWTRLLFMVNAATNAWGSSGPSAEYSVNKTRKRHINHTHSINGNRTSMATSPPQGKADLRGITLEPHANVTKKAARAATKPWRTTTVKRATTKARLLVKSKTISVTSYSKVLTRRRTTGFTMEPKATSKLNSAYTTTSNGTSTFSVSVPASSPNRLSATDSTSTDIHDVATYNSTSGSMSTKANGSASSSVSSTSTTMVSNNVSDIDSNRSPTNAETTTLSSTSINSLAGNSTAAFSAAPKLASVSAPLSTVSETTVHAPIKSTLSSKVNADASSSSSDPVIVRTGLPTVPTRNITETGDTASVTDNVTTGSSRKSAYTLDASRSLITLANGSAAVETQHTTGNQSELQYSVPQREFQPRRTSAHTATTGHVLDTTRRPEEVTTKTGNTSVSVLKTGSEMVSNAVSLKEDGKIPTSHATEAQNMSVPGMVPTPSTPKADEKETDTSDVIEEREDLPSGYRQDVGLKDELENLAKAYGDYIVGRSNTKEKRDQDIMDIAARLRPSGDGSALGLFTGSNDLGTLTVNETDGFIPGLAVITPPAPRRQEPYQRLRELLLSKDFNIPDLRKLAILEELEEKKEKQDMNKNP
ncbi:uncharacterized protein LOC135370213 [Ornithodoros turicata]|uniref:uncharacterized protein LOC135370213 n=1 Tax=Ornithodoros turicata TaxID=34597 RepID=UPI003138E0BB